MSKPEWGTKPICQSCATKFYDFGRTPITCPKCSAVFDPEVLLKSRRPRPTAPAKSSKPTAPVIPDADVDNQKDADLPSKDDDLADLPDDDDDDDEDEPAIEDPSELGEDDEETSKVIVPGKSAED